MDLADYTALTYSWDALDLRDMLSGYFDLARSIVGKYGGEVEKFIGDAIVAVWGATRRARTTPSVVSSRASRCWRRSPDSGGNTDCPI